MTGNGLLFSEGEFWRRQRRLVQPGFHRDRIAEYSQVIVRLTQQMLAPWQSGEIRDIYTEMTRLTLAVVSKTLFGAEVADRTRQVEKAITVLLQQESARSNNLFNLPQDFPTPGNLRAARALRQLDAVILEIINQRRASEEDHGDLLSMLLQVQDEDGSQMTDQQLRDEVMLLFLAGHETTANALSWTWHLLSKYPAIEEKLVDEIQTVLGGRAPTFADVPRLRYTEMVVAEAMRVFPPVWAFGRQAVEDCRLGGYPVPAGTVILMSQWVMHRHPQYFPEPDRFNPDRWTSGLARQVPAYAYFPFGGGPRLCVGKSFAQVEAVLVLASVAQAYQLRLVPGFEVVPHPMVTLRPKAGLKMHLTQRIH